jgi:hypothetical protein
MNPNKSFIFNVNNIYNENNLINLNNNTNNIHISILKNTQSEKDLEQINYSNNNKENLLSTGKKNRNNNNRIVENDSNIMNSANKKNSIQENLNFQNNNISMTNINCASNYNNNNNNNNMIGLPNIENFFIIKDKVFLVDNEKSVWHLKKCKKFDKIQKEFLKENNLTEEFLKNNINNFNNENQNETSSLNIRNQIFNNFLDFYQGLDNQINSNLRENNQSNNLISENDLRSQNNLESNAECKSQRTTGENKILNSSNISKQINFSYNNIVENLNNNNISAMMTKFNNISSDSKKLNNRSKISNSAEKTNSNNDNETGTKANPIYIENDCNSFNNEENVKIFIDQSKLILNEKSNLKNNYEENFENPDNTITSMDLVSDYSRKLNREFINDNSEIIRNIEDTKEERNDYQVFEIKDKLEENAYHERNFKGNRDVDKDTTYNLSEDSS